MRVEGIVSHPVSHPGKSASNPRDFETLPVSHPPVAAPPTIMSAEIPFVDLKSQYAAIRPEVLTAVEQVLESGRFVLGPEVSNFESEFAAYCGTRACVGVNTGTSAIHLALLALGIGPGDEVITVPFTFVATAAAIRYTGARPVFVDVDPSTLTMDPAQLERVLTPRTRAIVPVHLYGRPAEMDPILAFASNHGLRVVEDACQAHGAEYRGRRVGSLGDLGCFSFYPGKNLGAYGEGGAVTTDDPELERTIRMLRDWGAEHKYDHRLQGYNYRLEELQAAILRVKLRQLESWTEARREAASAYDERLSRGRLAACADRHVYHIYAIRAASREMLQARLEKAGIHTGIHYPIPVHLQKAHADLGHGVGDFPNSEAAASEVLSLPMFPELTTAQIERVCGEIESAWS